MQSRELSGRPAAEPGTSWGLWADQQPSLWLLFCLDRERQEARQREEGLEGVTSVKVINCHILP